MCDEGNNQVSETAALDSRNALAEYRTKMRDEEWVTTLADGRRVQFTYQELLDDGKFLTAQVEGNEVVYSILLVHTRNPLNREEVESRFEGELSRK
jgi:hypothetical protein